MAAARGFDMTGSDLDDLKYVPGARLSSQFRDISLGEQIGDAFRFHPGYWEILCDRCGEPLLVEPGDLIHVDSNSDTLCRARDRKRAAPIAPYTAGRYQKCLIRRDLDSVGATGFEPATSASRTSQAKPRQ